jgi:hypothetical protein
MSEIVLASEQPEYRLPRTDTLERAIKLAIVEDKPIMLDYWVGSLDKTVLIGINPEKEKILVRNQEEYTSIISKILKYKTEFIVISENSIYIVDSEIPVKKLG